MSVPLLDRIRGHAAARPEAIAVDEGDRRVTYRALVEMSDGCAARLGPGKVVGLVRPRGAEWIAWVLGSWAAGAVPLPIDPGLPEARRQAYLQAAGARWRVDDAVTELGPAPHRPPWAWIVFTSGTSGRPKGVCVPHDGVLPMLRDQRAAFEVDATSRCLWALSPGFDASFSDVGVALLAGATVVVDEGLRLDRPASVVRTLRRGRITHADLPPALLAHLDPAAAPDSLRTVVIGGEAPDPAAVRRWTRRCRVVNVYGPTEATVCSSLRVCGPDWDRPDIGATIGGAVYRLEGAELWIGGPGFAAGYLDPATTAARFVRADGQRWFRTRDRVRRDPDGALVFVGRLDRQMKRHGQLVAPEEIEAALVAHPAVTRAAVRTAPVLEAFVTGEVDADGLRAHLQARLPGYMVPGRLVVVPRLPETPNGKVDFAALAADEPAPAASPEAALLAEVVAEVLGVPTVDPSQSFAALGGTSLTVLEVAVRCEAAGWPVAPEALWSAPRLDAVAARPAAGRPMRDLMTEASRWASAPMPSPGADPSAGVLVTGATGGLGARVLRALSAAPARPLYALARDGALPAEARVAAALDAAGGRGPARVHVLAGDLTRDRLGLDEATYARLAAEVGHVVHLAAEVSLAGDWARLVGPNLGGTARLLAFAGQARPKRFTYASTLSVFVGTDRPEGHWRETDDFLTEARVFGGYAQTKVAAEALVRRAAPESQVLRYGLLVGAGRRHAWFDRTVRGLAALGAAPDPLPADLALDVTDVDWAARATADLVRGPETGAFHLCAPRPTQVAALLDAVEAETGRLERLEPEAFRNRVRAAGTLDAAVAGLALCRAFGRLHRQPGLDLFEATGARFDAARARAAGIPAAPEPTQDELRRHVRAALEAKR